MSILKNKTLITMNLRIHFVITRESTQRNLAFYAEAKPKNYKEKKRKLRKLIPFSLNLASFYRFLCLSDLIVIFRFKYCSQFLTSNFSEFSNFVASYFCK